MDRMNAEQVQVARLRAVVDAARFEDEQRGEAGWSVRSALAALDAATAGTEGATPPRG